MGPKMGANATVERLIELKLKSMADGFRSQISDPENEKLSFENRMAMLVDAEYSSRHNVKLQKLIKTAAFDIPSASIYDINYQSGRKLDEELISKLGSCDYIRKKLNIAITGATGSGKTYLSCALGMEACKRFYSTKYVRMPDLLWELDTANEKVAIRKTIQKYVKPRLLILDEWLIYPVDPEKNLLLFEIINGRYGKASTIFCSQYKMEGWYQQLGDKNTTLADAIMDRIAHNSYHIDITPIDPTKDISMRAVYGLDYILQSDNDNKENTLP